MKNFLTHTELVKIFKGGFCHSLNNRTEFEKGIDDYVLPSIMNDVQVRVLTVKQGSIGIDEIKAELCDFIKKEEAKELNWFWFVSNIFAVFWNNANIINNISLKKTGKHYEQRFPTFF